MIPTDNYLYSQGILIEMDSHLSEIDEAKKHLLVADHILTVTYPIVNDPKILLSVVENLDISFSKAISAVLSYEHSLGIIPSYHDTPDGKLEAFKEKIVKKHNITPEQIRMIEEIRSILQEHKESPVEFSKKDEFVICADEFKRIKTIDIKEMKEQASNAKIFIDCIANIVGKK